MIPREIIEEIIYRNDIEEVISSYVTLKRAGSNYTGLCPFHNEKTPSFTVFSSSKNFYCFGCGAGGDVITFIMKAENLDYPSALEFLAKRAGITLPQNGERIERGISRNRIFEMNLAAAKFFRQCLFDPAIGGQALDYLSKERRLSGAVIKHFGLGFSPNNFGALTTHMKKLGFTDEELTVGFLCGKSQKNGKTYDYFRNRVMFPIIDVSGNVIAFGGRVMDDSKPKYLNSSDTPGFKKSKNLFALNYAKKNCGEQLILCEGYMDVIALHAAGFENAVPTLGTAITPEQAKLISKYTKSVLISYDMDEAGRRAADKAMKLLSDVDVDVKVLRMNGAKDPDEYIKTYGADKFRQVIGRSQSSFDYKLDSVISKYDITIPDEKIKAAAELCKIIAAVYSGVERSVYISAVADKLGLTTDVVKNDVERMRNSLIRKYKAKEGHDAQMSAKNIGDRVNPDAAKNIQATYAEEVILGLMLLFDDRRAEVASGKTELSAEDFCTSFGKRVFEAILELENSEGGFMYSMLGEKFTVDEMGRMQQMEHKRRQLVSNGSDVLLESIKTLKNAKINAADSRDLLSELAKKQAILKQKKDNKK